MQPQEFAQYLILFMTFPEQAFPAAEVLEWYRTRWQVELVFKCFQSLAQLGHLLKRTDESARAWIYGKLLVALLVEKLHSLSKSAPRARIAFAEAPHLPHFWNENYHHRCFWNIIHTI